MCCKKKSRDPSCDVSCISTNFQDGGQLNISNENISRNKEDSCDLIFKHLQEEFNVDAPGLKPLCPTRWTVRTSAINSILKNYDVICTELEQVSNESGDSATQASGYTALMEKFETLFGLCLSYLVFSATEEVSKVLQGHDLNAQDAAGLSLKQYRS